MRFTMGIAPDPSSQFPPPTVRVTGNGADITPPTFWGVQQTATGPLNSASLTTLSYSVDLAGGNSGCPVIDEGSGEAVGIKLPTAAVEAASAVLPPPSPIPTCRPRSRTPKGRACP